MKNGSASERGYRILKSMKKLLLISVTNAISYFLSNQVKKKTQSKRKIYILGKYDVILWIMCEMQTHSQISFENMFKKTCKKMSS